MILSGCGSGLTDDDRSRLRDFARAAGGGPVMTPSASPALQLTNSYIDGQYRICIYGRGSYTQSKVISRGLRCSAWY